MEVALQLCTGSRSVLAHRDLGILPREFVHSITMFQILSHNIIIFVGECVRLVNICVQMLVLYAWHRKYMMVSSTSLTGRNDAMGKCNTCMSSLVSRSISFGSLA